MTELAISNYMRNDVIKSRFAEVIGDRNAGAYIASVLLAVANDSSGLLRQATPESIYISALRAASLRLSVDPSTGQAYLVPFRSKGNVNATLIIGYKGLYDMAVRTGRYRYINVGKVYEGEQVIEDRISGFHRLDGHKENNTIIGWIGGFEMVNGYGKTAYMTVQEIHEHARKYSKSYDNNGSLWKQDPHTMERKTVLRLMLRRWGYLDPSDAAIVDQVDEDNLGVDIETIDVETGEITTRHPQSENDLMQSLGFDVDESEEEQPPITAALPRETPVMTLETAQAVTNSKGEAYGDIDTETLSHMANNISKQLKKTDLLPEQRDEYNLKMDAIKVIMAHRAEQA